MVMIILASVVVVVAGLFVGTGLAVALLRFRRRPTSGGVELTEPLIDQLAEEAQAGYDVERLRPRTHRNMRWRR
jgi:hypothetical protein